MRTADLVRPQNVFDPLPWHARWDTARMLLNRAFGSDHPGTLGVRRSFLASIGGYDGDVLFENLELVRTVLAAGGRVVDAPGMYVRRRPPTPARFLEQRPRQAYDDLAQPARLAFFLVAGAGARGDGAASTSGSPRGGRRIGPRGAGRPAPARGQRGLRPGLAASSLPSGSWSAPAWSGWRSSGGSHGEAARMPAASSGGRRLPLGSSGGGCGDGSRTERHDLVGAVAERLRGRPAASADRVHAAPDRDLVSPLVERGGSAPARATDRRP